MIFPIEIVNAIAEQSAPCVRESLRLASVGIRRMVEASTGKHVTSDIDIKDMAKLSYRIACRLLLEIRSVRVTLTQAHCSAVILLHHSLGERNFASCVLCGSLNRRHFCKCASCGVVLCAGCTSTLGCKTVCDQHHYIICIRCDKKQPRVV